MVIGIGAGSLITVIFFCGKELLFSMFTGDQRVHRIIEEIFLILSLSQPLNALVYTSDGLIFASSKLEVLSKGMLIGFFALFLPGLFITSFYFPRLDFYGMPSYSSIAVAYFTL